MDRQAILGATFALLNAAGTLGQELPDPNPVPQSDHGSPCPKALESEEFEDCCVLDNPREGRKYNTNPQYEFYAKYRAQIRGMIAAIPKQTQLNP